MGSRLAMWNMHNTHRLYLLLSKDTVQELPKGIKGRRKMPKALQSGGLSVHPASPGTSPRDTSFLNHRAREEKMWHRVALPEFPSIYFAR